VVYNMSKEERTERGLAGREWVTSEESGCTAKNMSKNIIKYMDQTLENFTPRRNFTFQKVEKLEPKTIKHKFIY